MLTPSDREVYQRVYERVPQFKKLLEHMLQQELSALPSVSSDKVQVYQGRCKVLQEILRNFDASTGTTADRIAKPNFSTP